MALPAWAPTPDQVATVLSSRTRGRDSIAATSARELGRFDETTRPTETQVRALIELACNDVAMRFAGRSPCTDAFEAAAATAAVYRTAQLIELSVLPERTEGGTAFDAFSALYNDAVEALAEAIIAGCPLDSEASP